MKKTVLFTALMPFCLCLGSCLKDNLDKTNSNSGTTGIVGRWSLVNDTTTTQYWGIWSGKPTVGENYIGKAGDYYDFTAYGKLYIHQNNTGDTLTYKLSHDTVMIRTAYIDGQTNKLDSTYNPWYVMPVLTAHKCTLTSFFISPETASFSTINLSR